MSSTPSNTGRSGSRRSGRRPRSGGRREGRREGSPRSSAASVATYSPKAEPGFWQKIVAFFTGKKPQVESAARPSRDGDSSRPAREGARSRHREAGDTPREPRSSGVNSERRSGLRKPEAVEVTSPRLYIGNLSFDATESDLFELFNGVGNVQNVEVVSNKHTLRSKGFAFVQMHSIDEAKRAVEELHDKEYMGRKLVVSGAKALDERRGDREERRSEREEAQPQPEQ